MASETGSSGSEAVEDDLIHCPICYDVFDNPRSMPCLHTYCLECLDSLCRGRNPGDDSVDCPICRKVCNIPSEGVAGFAHNFIIQRMVDAAVAAGTVKRKEVSVRSATTKTAATAAVNAMQPNDDSSGSSVSKTCTVERVIAASEDRKGEVRGLTVYGDELFLVRRLLSEGHVEVYSATTCTFKRNIKVRELEGRDDELKGLTSCQRHKCLYVSYWYIVGEGRIVRVELTGDNKVVRWTIKDGSFEPRGLSVNGEHNLIVACGGWRSPRLIEYTTRGELVREILLRDGAEYPQHALQLNSGQFLVSHGQGEALHRVCLVDANGRVLLSFGNKHGAESGQLSDPQQLAVDRNGFIFVADYSNNRIVVLDSTLRWSRDLLIDGGGSKVMKPCSLYLDGKRNLLFVGDASRVVVVTC